MDTSISPVQTAMTPQAGTDSQLISLWLHGRGINTQQAYRTDIGRFLSFVGVPLPQVTLGDLQSFADSIQKLAPSSQKRILSSVKSLMTFGQKVGYLTYNVGAALKLPKPKDTLAERILPETAVHAMIACEPDKRKRVLLRVLYASGGRVSEICALRWKDAQERKQGGQINIYGKGGKTRVVLLSADTWHELLSLQRASDAQMPVFPTRTGRPLSRVQVRRIVQSAARRAGISANVSPHWLRHAHATHALERGCPIHLV